MDRYTKGIVLSAGLSLAFFTVSALEEDRDSVLSWASAGVSLLFLCIASALIIKTCEGEVSPLERRILRLLRQAERTNARLQEALARQNLHAPTAVSVVILPIQAQSSASSPSQSEHPGVVPPFSVSTPGFSSLTPSNAASTQCADPSL